MKLTLKPAGFHVPLYLSRTALAALLALLAMGLAPEATAVHAQAGKPAVPDAGSKQSGTATALQEAPATAKPAAAAASTPAASTAAAAPPAMPAMVGPLAAEPARSFDAGPFGTLDLTGVLSGFGSWQGHPATTDHASRADISNGQVFLQKTSGLVQFFLQAGAYNLPSLGTPFLSTRNTVSDYFGALPQAYLKLAPKGNFSFLIGKLPTLIGAEDTFTFQNMDIERGLLWNQENAVDRGAQINYSKGKLVGSLSWNDGFYSNRFNWLMGALTYSPTAADSVEFVGMGNLGRTAYSSAATPLYQNNSRIYDVIYTHTAKRWLVQPYFQYTDVPADLKIGVGHATSTQGEAVLGSYSLGHGVTLAGRAEYISSSGSSADKSVNLLYGTGSQAWSITLTPTYQKKAFFARGEFSFTQALNATPGQAFGTQGTNATQARALLETGFIF